MSDLHIRQDGCAGRITLQRPKALNALTYEMVLEIEGALDLWASDNAVALIILDAEGARAFCSGGDIADMYASGLRGDYAYGRKFWRDEYRMNAKIFEYSKPVVSFLQGFTMGGGVGVGCHGSHRIVGETSQIAMPECGIGLVPDIGGSLMLTLAPGRLGEYLGVTSARMGPADAIFAGFADHFIAEDKWPDAIARLCRDGIETLAAFYSSPAPGTLPQLMPQIDTYFAGETLGDIVRLLQTGDEDFAAGALKAISRNAPLAMECAISIIRRLRNTTSIRQALDMEYRYTYRAVEQGDFIEGIRAAIIDRDRQPKWAHPAPDQVPLADVARMLMPLKENALNWEGMA